MSSSLGGSIDWDNLNSCTIQELKAACAEKNLRLEGKPTKARYVETLEKYKSEVIANETPKRRRGRQKSSQTTPAQSPAQTKPAAQPAQQKAAETPVEQNSPQREEVRQVSPLITERVSSPVVQRSHRHQSPVQSALCAAKCELMKPQYLILLIFIGLSFLMALKETFFPSQTTTTTTNP